MHMPLEQIIKLTVIAQIALAGVGVLTITIFREVTIKIKRRAQEKSGWVRLKR